MNNYRGNGGGNYYMYKGKPVVKEILTDMVELIANYIGRNREITIPDIKNIQVIKN